MNTLISDIKTYKSTNTLVKMKSRQNITMLELYINHFSIKFNEKLLKITVATKIC